MRHSAYADGCSRSAAAGATVAARHHGRAGRSATAGRRARPAARPTASSVSGLRWRQASRRTTSAGQQVLRRDLVLLGDRGHRPRGSGRAGPPRPDPGRASATGRHCVAAACPGHGGQLGVSQRAALARARRTSGELPALPRAAEDVRVATARPRPSDSPCRGDDRGVGQDPAGRDVALGGEPSRAVHSARTIGELAAVAQADGCPTCGATESAAAAPAAASRTASHSCSAQVELAGRARSRRPAPSRSSISSSTSSAA